MITVYSKNQCPQCVMTKNVLLQKGVKFNEINLDAQPDYANVVQQMGYRSVPVVAMPDKHWSGFRPDLLRAI